MAGRKVLIYYAWSRPGETSAPLEVLDDRFPALFEVRRMLYPRYSELSDPLQFDQSIGGFLNHIMKANFADFISLTEELTSHAAIVFERVGNGDVAAPLDTALKGSFDTVIIISFDSFRTHQAASPSEVAAASRFLENPDNLLFVCPHHDIGEATNLGDDKRGEWQQAEFRHHGDKAIPGRQGFGGFARSLLKQLGVPVENQFGFHPAMTVHDEPAPIHIAESADRLGLLHGVTTFNAHPHLPHLERLAEATDRMEVLAKQSVDPHAPPHLSGRTDFDAMLQSKATTFPGTLIVCDTTLFSSTAGGVGSLQKMWANILTRP